MTASSSLPMICARTLLARAGSPMLRPAVEGKVPVEDLTDTSFDTMPASHDERDLSNNPNVFSARPIHVLADRYQDSSTPKILFIRKKQTVQQQAGPIRNSSSPVASRPAARESSVLRVSMSTVI
eukprot:scaffold722_cov255-Prasinococcus_capsulatus_cf.AAC.11